jgi:hypothetical protein
MRRYFAAISTFLVNYHFTIAVDIRIVAVDDGEIAQREHVHAARGVVAGGL